MNTESFFSHRGAIEGGINVFAKQDFYWSNLPRDIMRQFLDLAETKGYAEALKEFPIGMKALQYIDDYSRADQIFFIPAAHDAVILDLGSGYGNVTIPLSKYVKHVVAADGTRELLRYSRTRAIEKGAENITYVHIDPIETKPLPFKEKSFDVIILSGVLEWIGAGNTELSPREAQHHALVQLARLLKDDGVIYVAIENRLFPGWIMRDPHSKLRWTSIAPRFVADWYARRHGFENGYRTYIYSLLGYRSLFRGAGLEIRKTYLPQPSYRTPTYIYGLEHRVRSYAIYRAGADMFTRKWRLFLRLLSLVRLDHIVLSSYMFVLKKPGSHSDVVPLVIDRCIHSGISGVTPRSSIFKLPSKLIDTASFLVFDEGGTQPPIQISMRRLPATEKEVLPVRVVDTDTTNTRHG